MNRDDVLKVVGEPAYYENTTSDGVMWVGRNRSVTQGHTSVPLYTEAQLLAMYAAGEEAMRERAKEACSDKAKSLLSIIDFPACQSKIIQRDRADQWGESATLISALPITTNTEGEQ